MFLEPSARCCGSLPLNPAAWRFDDCTTSPEAASCLHSGLSVTAWKSFTGSFKSKKTHLTDLACNSRQLWHDRSSAVTNSVVKTLRLDRNVYTLYHYCSPYYVITVLVLFLATSVCLCVCLSLQNLKKLPIRNGCNLVGICPMVNARSDSKLVAFDFDLWPWELLSYFFYSGYIFQMAWPSNFIFSLATHLQNI